MYSKKIDIRWADLDPNFHVLHSKYYDFCAYCRTCFLYDNNITAEVMAAHHIGPILFREECVFRKEIRFGADVTVYVELAGASQNFGKWSMRHRIMLGEETLAATINVDGAWIDLNKRKLATPPELITEVFALAPRAEDFKFL